MGDILSPKEREELNTLLGSPLHFPPEFKSWLPEFLAQNLPYLPLNQISGSQIFQPRSAIVNTGENTTETGVWGDIFATEGPRINNVNAGDYLVIWGYWYSRGGTGGAKVECGPSIDGNDPTVYISPPFVNDQAWFNWRAARITVSGDAVHFVKLKYRADLGGGASGHVERRWLVLVRVK